MNEHLVTIAGTPFSAIDILALAWFFLCTIGYGIVADYHRTHDTRSSIIPVMNNYRLQWMRQVLKREQRIMDASIMNTLLRSISFFASTSIIIAASLLAAMSYREKAQEIIGSLPFVVNTTASMWEMKLLLLVLIFIYAFFKFTWSMRTHHYTCILIGAAPLPKENPESHEEYARKAALVAMNAAKHYNQGMRAYYYGLAAVGWFLHPIVFMVTMSWVIAVIYRREFHSNTLASLLG